MIPLLKEISTYLLINPYAIMLLMVFAYADLTTKEK